MTTTARVDTSPYRRSHWQDPKPSTVGTWLFRNTDTGEEADHYNTSYRDAVAKLPAGNWQVLP